MKAVNVYEFMWYIQLSIYPSKHCLLRENLFFFSLQKLLRAVGLFAGSIFLMRNYGDLMAI